jgi:hypothetical protein
MDEYAALAQRVVLTMDDVRGCLVLSRDGMILGAYPEEDEQAFKPAWLTFAHVGEARRGFVEFSDQMWAYVHRGPYAAFVIAGTGVRPGVLLDQLEQAVLAAEETRAKKGETLKVPDASSAPSGRPRTSLHPPEPRATPDPEPGPEPTPVASAPPPEQRAWNGRLPTTPPPEAVGVGAGADPVPAAEPQPVVDHLRPATFDAELAPAGAAIADIEVTPAGRPAAFAVEGSPFARLEAEQAEAASARATSVHEPAGPAETIAGLEPLAAPPLTGPADTPGPAPDTSDTATDVARTGDPDGAAAFRREPQRLVSSGSDAAEADPASDEPGEVDRVMLAKEFSGLLQLNEDGDEDNS